MTFMTPTGVVRGILLSVALSVPPTAACGAEVPSSTAEVKKLCAPGESAQMGAYQLRNNLWGRKHDPSGTQCSWAGAPTANGGVSWSSDWNWGGNGMVKSYAAAVQGWHWGWQTAKRGLPVRVGDHVPVKTSWKYRYKPRGNMSVNISYDLWFHANTTPKDHHDPSDELMVWLYSDIGGPPAGKRQGRVRLAGADWDLYVDQIGWNVYKFVRVGNTDHVKDFNLTEFTDEVVRRGLMSPDKYLTGIEAGPEARRGSGQLDTLDYRVKVG